MAQSLPRFDYKKAAPTSFEDMVQLAYMNCVTAFRILETEGRGVNGSNVFSASPSHEEFVQSVRVLLSMLNGAGWLDDEFIKDIDETNLVEYEVDVRVPATHGGGFDQIRKEKRTRLKTPTEQDTFDLFTAITSLLIRRKVVFHEKSVDLGTI